MDLFDTHFHLPDAGVPDDYLTPLPEAFRFRLMTLGGSAASSRQAADFAMRHDAVWCGCGIHPHEAAGFTGSTAEFRDLAQSSAKVRAVGEIGLDYFYDFAPRAIQRRTLEAFLALALELDLPAVIHCRDQADRHDAYCDGCAMLREFAADGGRFEVHCYAGTPEYLEKFLELGAFLGVTGMVTFPKSVNIRENLGRIPADRLLIETDAPYLAPVPHRGKENHPAFLPVIAEFVARERRMPLEELARVTTRNGLRFFRIGEDEK